jgi:ribulose-phosphate 3-epimerase
MQIIPTVLEKDFSEAEKRITNVMDRSSWLQIDVTDNIFTLGKTFELELLTKVEVSLNNNLIDIHLMVKEPKNWLKKAFFAGASRIIGQVEMMGDREEFVKTIKDEGVEAGLAFDIETEADDNIPEDTDVILLMGRKAGFGSFELDERVFKKIELIKKLERDIRIGVDGGINLVNIKRLEDAGVDIAYCGQDYIRIKENYAS